jgi:hypothetical protein
MFSTDNKTLIATKGYVVPLVDVSFAISYGVSLVFWGRWFGRFAWFLAIGCFLCLGFYVYFFGEGYAGRCLFLG